MKNKIDEIIDRVQKPGRYIGCETNSVRKKHGSGKISMVLAYPDMYEIGMSYLGLKILYHLLNEKEDVVCERVFAPWADMEKELADNEVKLFSLENRKSLDEFDVIGFSLCYELTYTNVLNMLHLGGVTLLADERREDEPIVIAGGACSYNPEPMSSFFDAFVIGDGEEVIVTLLDVCKKSKETGCTRKETLKKLSKIKGVYVPSLYRAVYEKDKFHCLEPVEKDVPNEVQRVAVKDMEKAYYPVKQIVPLVKIVHDRIAVEIMRGCPNKCRFCQASSINRPVRVRSAGKIRTICRETYKNTGYENIALLSLSSINYPYLGKLVKGLSEDFKKERVGISIPSLRVDEAFYKLPEMISAIKKSGLTFAVESADEETRAVLDKNIDNNVLCRSAQEAFKHGWRRLKLYFMVGFPDLKKDETRGIMDLAFQLSGLKKGFSGGAAEIKVNVNAFVPKPHTPLQWVGMRDKEHLIEIRRGLMSRSTKKVKTEFSNIEQSLLEGGLARGDRRIAGVILEAWENGAKMDSWNDYFDINIWRKAFKRNGMDLDECAGRSFDTEDVLPWDHVQTDVKKEWLKREFLETGFNV
ncbi:MAG: TIGR03960 family B12-binding radical SAM protein [Candidatus Aadella gelida]|nr:TIGR03960 family B12-binding radical SAM protein [Candidatus Aadella gelida]